MQGIWVTPVHCLRRTFSVALGGHITIRHDFMGQPLVVIFISVSGGTYNASYYILQGRHEGKCAHVFVSGKWLHSGRMYFDDWVACWLTYLISGWKMTSGDWPDFPDLLFRTFAKNLVSQENEAKTSVFGHCSWGQLLFPLSLYRFCCSLLHSSHVMNGSPTPCLLLLCSLPNPFWCCAVGTLGFPCLPLLITSVAVTTHFLRPSLHLAGTVPRSCN